MEHGPDYYAPVWKSDWRCERCEVIRSCQSGAVMGPPGHCECGGWLREVRETRVLIRPLEYDQEHLDRCAAAGISPHWPFFPVDGDFLGESRRAAR